jgi:hypothetical protein
MTKRGSEAFLRVFERYLSLQIKIPRVNPSFRLSGTELTETGQPGIDVMKF